MSLRREGWLVILLAIAALLVGACAAPAQQAATEPAGEAEASGPIEIEVWAQANNVEHWRADGPAQAAEMVEGFELSVVPLNDDAGWADYKKKFTLAADAGEAPDIVCSGH